MTENDDQHGLASGRRVSLLPRAGGPAYPAVVRAWVAAGDQVVARVEAEPPAVTALDHHQLWLSTVTRSGEEHGVTIFAGRARAVEPTVLDLEGVVRLAHEARRRAVRAPGATVTVPLGNRPQQSLQALDLSRGGVRLLLGDEAWNHGDKVDMEVHLDDRVTVTASARLLRLDDDGRSAVLGFVGLPESAALAIDHHVLGHLSKPG